MKVLVISADAEAAAAASRQLTAGAVRIEVSLEAGLERLQGQAFDALLLDLAAAGDLKGAAFDRAQAHAPALPIVLLCDPDDEAAALEAVGRGAQDFLLRGSVEGVDLARLLRCALARQGSLAGLRRSLAEHEASELALRKSEAYFRSHFELPLIGVAITDLEKGWVRVNDRLCQILGYSRDELVRRTWAEITHPDDVAADVGEFNRVLAGEIEGYSMEKRFIRGDGGVIHAAISARCVRKGDGTIDYFVGLVQEITERKLAEAALRESEARFKLLFEQVPDALALGDPQGRCLDVNLAFAELTGLPRERLIGRTFVEHGLVAPPNRPLMSETIRQVVAGGVAPPIDLTLIRPDGVRREVEARFFPVRSGGEILLLNSLRDVTRHKRAEENLRQSEEHLRLANAELSGAMRLKDEFLSSMSHELRTPLNAVLGLAESLSEGVYGLLEARQRGAVSDIAQSGQHLLSLINDILDLSKIEADRLSLELQPVLVKEICEASLRLVREQAQYKQISIGLSIGPGARVVQADPRRLKQIFFNLLSNAVKFTPAGGQVGIEVEADLPVRMVRFTFWDTGIGIPPEQLGRLFQPFVQLDSELSRLYNGTGLGLALVRRLANLHGGSVSVTSEPGSGSRFTLALPDAEEALAALKAPARERRGEVAWREVASPPKPGLWPEAAQAGPQRGRILVAEDSRINQEMLQEYLSGRGHTVYEARNGTEAVEQAFAHMPDLILMDIQMPQLDGLEAMRRIRATPALARVPIIALTALAMAGDRDRCLAAGASAYLAKPVELRALGALIDELLTLDDAVAAGEG